MALYSILQKMYLQLNIKLNDQKIPLKVINYNLIKLKIL